MADLLALGTVVEVQMKGTKPFQAMIAGYYPTDPKENKTYDYATVLYPVGMALGNMIVQMIDKKSIIRVIAPGYLDEQGEIFVKEIPKMLKAVAEVAFQESKKAKAEADAAKVAAETQAASSEQHKPTADEAFG